MRCLVVGFGSIGKKHAQILKNLGCKVSVVTSQKSNEYVCYGSIAEAFNKELVDYVIIANATHLHHSALLTLIQCDFRGVVLVEKPLFAKMEHLPKNNIAKILVAYNLRSHELLRRTQEIIKDERLITFSAYVGQYLPTWRKTDYRQSYSAKKEQGGGVLRDLSHELDYSIWFCGPCLAVSAVGGHFSELEIDSDDVYSIMMKCIDCPIVNIHVNYLDRCTRREISINTQQKTIMIDLIKGTLSVNGEIQNQYSEGVAHTYIQQHSNIMNKNYDSFCSYSDGLSLVKLIETIEGAAISREWINL